MLRLALILALLPCAFAGAATPNALFANLAACQNSLAAMSGYGIHRAHVNNAKKMEPLDAELRLLEIVTPPAERARLLAAAQHATAPGVAADQLDVAQLLRAERAYKAELRKLAPETSQLLDEYRIAKVLGQGGFGVTLLMEERRDPSKPLSMAQRLVPPKRFVLKVPLNDVVPGFSVDDQMRVLQKELFVAEVLGEEIPEKREIEPEFPSRFPRPAVRLVGPPSRRVQFDGRPYLRMEHLQAVDLEAHIADLATAANDGTSTAAKQIAAAEKYLDLMQQVVDRLDIMHKDGKDGVAHIDLKPQNIMVLRRPVISKADNQVLVPTGSPLLIDFGLTDIDQSKAPTASDRIAGTPLYIGAGAITGRPDIRDDGYAVYRMSEAGLLATLPVADRQHIALYENELGLAAAPAASSSGGPPAPVAPPPLTGTIRGGGAFAPVNAQAPRQGGPAPAPRQPTGIQHTTMVPAGVELDANRPVHPILKQKPRLRRVLLLFRLLGSQAAMVDYDPAKPIPRYPNASFGDLLQIARAEEHPAPEKAQQFEDALAFYASKMSPTARLALWFGDPETCTVKALDRFRAFPNPNGFGTRDLVKEALSTAGEDLLSDNSRNAYAYAPIGKTVLKARLREEMERYGFSR